MPRIPLYNLRHLCASLLAPLAPLKLISDYLGHSSVQVTGDVCQHLLPGAQEAAVRALEGLLFATPGLHQIRQNRQIKRHFGGRAKARVQSVDETGWGRAIPHEYTLSAFKSVSLPENRSRSR